MNFGETMKKKYNKPYQKHGLTTMKRKLKVLGIRAIDQRTQLGKALAQWKADLVRDLGGNSQYTTKSAD